MSTFSQFLKQIRATSELSQKELADILGFSTILIVKLETGAKRPSKKFITTLAKKMDVRPASITPFMLDSNSAGAAPLSNLEKKLLALTERIQLEIINRDAKRLKHNAKR